ncbi:MAG: sulfate adenylyltransferase subunit 2 [Candidatus Omnitrophica bacterium]|nr:sulfate adenylyltransferase subunit 2 [Candidatus Omnitrophota bacterium]
MNSLEKLENNSIYIIREAYSRFRNIALLWSIGKDSTTLLWLCRKAFFGKIPFPILHIDTSYKFQAIYDFRKKYAKDWNLQLIIEKNERALANGMNNSLGKFECCDSLKTQTLKRAVEKHHFKAIILGIRRDEHGIRAKERFFSTRNSDHRWDYGNQAPELWDLYQAHLEKDQHLRVHPLLGWREIDVWNYIQQEKIPVADLYFSKNGQRFRSIGCEPCCSPIPSKANSLAKIIAELKTTKIAERSGRSQDKEDSYNMQKLRSLGYM